jgi:hypothetical protein
MAGPPPKLVVVSWKEQARPSSAEIVYLRQLFPALLAEAPQSLFEKWRGTESVVLGELPAYKANELAAQAKADGRVVLHMRDVECDTPPE